MADATVDRGLIDTSVVIALELIDREVLPAELAVSAITLAELAAGPHATEDATERARRQERLQLTEATFDPIPFDAACARAYARVFTETLAAGRKARGRRAVDLLIAATAVASGLPLYTANPDDFAGLDGLLQLNAVNPMRAKS
ncbi:MAG: type II toxin-antitoxin system VapC family toxin [Solirubrobacteraceae bacterium]